MLLVKNDCMNKKKKYFIKDKCIQKQRIVKNRNIPIGTLKCDQNISCLFDRIFLLHKNLLFNFQVKATATTEILNWQPMLVCFILKLIVRGN